MLVSIIIPVYNAEKTLIKCIESVVVATKESNVESEIICVNDGSTDNSLSILKELEKKYHQIIIIDQENKGAASARNAGLNIAKGDFIAFNDSDDEWTSTHLTLLLSLFEKYQDVDCISCMHDRKAKVCVLKKIEKDLFLVKLQDELFKNYFSPQTALIRRKVIDKGIRFLDNMRHSEEVLFFMRIVSNNKCFFLNTCVSKNILGKARWGEKGLSGSLWKMEKGELKSINFARKKLHINFILYTIAMSFSFLKYLRRVIVTTLRLIFYRRIKNDTKKINLPTSLFPLSLLITLSTQFVFFVALL